MVNEIMQALLFAVGTPETVRSAVKRDGHLCQDFPLSCEFVPAIYVRINTIDRGSQQFERSTHVGRCVLKQINRPLDTVNGVFKQ